MLFAFTNNVQASVPSVPEDEILCADVNEDGLVNVLDIITLVNYIMGASPDPFNEEAADINADSFINVLDIIALVNIIMQVPGIPCPCIPSVTYEGHIYNTVQIGDQCWFRENLNVGTKINSTQGGFQQTDNVTIEKYCYNNDEMNCNTYGGLYEWPEAMQYVTTEGAQGICPTGWHIPTDGEFTALTDYLGGSSVAGGKMKSTGTIEDGTGIWHAPNIEATNESGFTGLPGGCRDYYDGSFLNLGYTGFFWSSSQYGTNSAWGPSLSYDYAGVDRDTDSKDVGYSIRCLKGCWPQPSQANAGLDQLNMPGTSITLAGNIPEYGTGLWTIVSGTCGTIADTASPASEFQGVAGNEYTLSWAITTQCGSSVDEVVISFASAGFTCGDDLDYEGQSYTTVLIGTQCWMAENLNVGVMINSTSGGFLQTDNDIIERYCYENDITYCDTYGGLYEWPEAMQYMATEGAQGICPEGWHLPTDGEWTTLSDYLGGASVAGGKMKSTGTIEEGTGLWDAPNTGATNISGFTGLPGGYRDGYYGIFNSLGGSGGFWSSSQWETYGGWYRGLSYSLADLYRYIFNQNYGFSIRCLKDQ